MSRASRLLILFSCWLSGWGAVCLASDWHHWRGPTYDGRAAGSGVFADAFGLERDWVVPLGPAYSGVVVSGNLAVTMLSDGESDLLAAFDVTTGEQAWRHRIDATYKGHDGSDDGSLSTPVIDGDLVYGLGPKGKLVAVELDSGDEVWTVDLADRFDAVEPDYGFTTTPLVAGSVLIVQTGGSDGRSISGLHKKTGKTLWSLRDDKIEYQSPTLMTLAGKLQVLTADPRNVAGLDPKSGEELWSFAHEGGRGTPGLIPLGGERFLIKNWSGIAAFELKKTLAGYEIDEVYRSKELSKSYMPPVLHDGHLYGFSATFLTCVDAGNGERVWKSRPPGGHGLVLVDGHLVILGSKGLVFVAEATPEGYLEKASVQALERSGLTWPSFAGGRVFVRNLEELAAVSITDRPRAATPATASSFADSEFHALVRKIEASTEKRTMIDRLIEREQGFPIVEGDELVHFVYRSDAEDVAILGSMLDFGAAESLVRIEGTDLFYRTFALDPGVRVEYRFQVDFEGHTTDPLNTSIVPDWWEGDWSVATLPGYLVPSHRTEPDNARGRVEGWDLESKVLGNQRTVKVYLPAAYDDGEQAYPVLVINEGLGWIDNGLLTNTLDHSIGKSVAPLIVAFVGKPEGGDWWNELGGSKSADYARMLVEELVPQIDERYRTRSEAESRAIMGTLASARAAAYTAVKHPDVFGKLAVRTMSLEGEIADELLAELGEAKRPSLELYVDWNRYERRSAEDGYDRREDSRRFAKALEDAGLRFAGGEAADSYGWGSLRAGNVSMLEALFPAR